MEKVVRINRLVNLLLGGFGIIICVGVVLLVVSDIIMRYFFNHPYTFSVEVTQIALVLIVFSFIPYSTSELRHVSIEVLVDKFPVKTKSILTVIGDLFCACIFILICRQSFLEGLDVKMFGSMTAELELPLYPFYFFVAFGALLSCVSLIVRSLEELFRNKESKV